VGGEAVGPYILYGKERMMGIDHLRGPQIDDRILKQITEK
jgi:hypothetical protein